jgi:AcrR family transcriptional regulator
LIESELRERLERSALILAGEHGYRALTVQLALEDVQVSRSRFYSLYNGKDDLFRCAYNSTSAWLIEEMLNPSKAAPDWLGCFRGALERLAAFQTETPDLARGLICEVFVAGGPTMQRRIENMERLSRAVDGARLETERNTSSAPPDTAPFLVSAIESVAIKALSSGHPEDFAVAVPDLLSITASYFFGPD